jgi:hypothetical protein
MSVRGTEAYAEARDLPEPVRRAVVLAAGRFDLLVLDGGGNGKGGPAADVERLLRPPEPSSSTT